MALSLPLRLDSLASLSSELSFDDPFEAFSPPSKLSSRAIDLRAIGKSDVNVFQYARMRTYVFQCARMRTLSGLPAVD